MSENNRSLKDIIKFRMDKIKTLKEHGLEVYPYAYKRSHKNAEIHNDKDNLISKVVTVAGRIVSLRNMGKSAFLNLQDNSGKIHTISPKQICYKFI